MKNYYRINMGERLMAYDVTVIMPAYREKESQIRQAIDSILCQTMREFRFIIILDDPENLALKGIIEEYVKIDDRITLYVNEKNGGCPYSKDRGIRLARTEYVAIMDSDDIAKAYRLEKQLHKIQEERLDIVASYVTVINEEGKPLYNMDNLPLTHDKIVKKMRVNNCMPHPTWFLKREVYLSLGGYRNMQGCEDYEFLIRAIQSGYKLGMVNDILLEYRLSSQSVSRSNLYRQYLMMRYLQEKYYHNNRLKYQSYEEYEKNKFDIKTAERYARASVFFERAILAKVEKKYLNMVAHIFRAMFSSIEYTKKIIRYIVQELG